MPTRFASLLLSLPLATSLLACGWNEVETGRRGLVQLTPDDCGKDGCDLDDGIAVGGSLSISLSGTDGRSAEGLRLISSAPWILDVVAESGTTFEPEFSVIGAGAGSADLIVIDRGGYEVDYLPVEVERIGSLEVDAAADGLEPIAVVGADRAFAAPAGAELRLDVAGLARGRELTGDVQYVVELDAALARNLQSGSDAARGHLQLVVPAGDHDVRFTAPGGARTIVRVRGL